MLVIPAMHIRGGSCTRTAIGEPGTEGLYPYSPVEVARLWRGENAKALHVVCFDLALQNTSGQIEQLREVVHAVDIAVQLGGVFASTDEVRLALEDIGVYRVVIDPAVFALGGEIDELILKYGPRKIVVALNVDGGKIISCENGTLVRVDAAAFALKLENTGVQRILVTEKRMEENLAGPPANFLLCLVETTNLSVTLNGSVRHYRDLKLLQNLHPRKIDSVVLDEVLYANVFPCQRIWRLAEQKLLAQHKLL
jgi:phosphoribosylformimino-5-aminoimidazole carboxamide ribotide isomerase